MDRCSRAAACSKQRSTVSLAPSKKLALRSPRRGRAATMARARVSASRTSWQPATASHRHGLGQPRAGPGRTRASGRRRRVVCAVSCTRSALVEVATTGPGARRRNLRRRARGGAERGAQRAFRDACRRDAETQADACEWPGRVGQHHRDGAGSRGPERSRHGAARGEPAREHRRRRSGGCRRSRGGRRRVFAAPRRHDAKTEHQTSDPALHPRKTFCHDAHGCTTRIV